MVTFRNHMQLGDLPLETQNRVLQFCSPGDVAVISRTHSSLRDAAEHVLYGRIDICTRQYNLLYDNSYLVLDEEESPLPTLITNPRKASIVKALYVHFGGICCHSMHLVVEKLAEALEKMSALVDLRIIYNTKTDPCGGRISQVIRGGYFKLNSLCLEGFHDIEGIVTEQPHLEVFGIFFNIDEPNTHLWETFERLSQTLSSQHPLPSFFMLDHKDHPVIYMLPFLYRPGEVPKVSRKTATLINKWPWGNGRSYSLGTSLLGISEKNINLVEETMVAMVQDCPRDPSYESVNISIIVHEKYIQKPWRFPAFFEPMTDYNHLFSLTFFVLGLDNYSGLCQMTNDLESCLLAKGLAWGHMKWPNLQSITIWCDPRQTKLWITLAPRDSSWYIVSS